MNPSYENPMIPPVVSDRPIDPLVPGESNLADNRPRNSLDEPQMVDTVDEYDHTHPGMTHAEAVDGAADGDLDTTDHLHDSTEGDGDFHATTGGSAAAGAVTGGVIGLAGAGPIGAAIGVVGGAIVGAISERVMHSDDDAERDAQGLDHEHDANLAIEDRTKEQPVGLFDGFKKQDEDVVEDVNAVPARDRLPVDTTNAEWDRDRLAGTTERTTDTNTIELHEEQLTPRVEQVEAGAVHVEKNVVSEQRTMEVPVTHDEVVVERHPVDRRPADQPISEQDTTIEVPVREERVTMEKQPVVYEEVTVGTRPVTETQRVSGTVRREEARVEREGDLESWKASAKARVICRYWLPYCWAGSI